jgi:hypothetical protein
MDVFRRSFTLLVRIRGISLSPVHYLSLSLSLSLSLTHSLCFHSSSVSRDFAIWLSRTFGSVASLATFFRGKKRIKIGITHRAVSTFSWLTSRLLWFTTHYLAPEPLEHDVIPFLVCVFIYIWRSEANCTYVTMYVHIMKSWGQFLFSPLCRG